MTDIDYIIKKNSFFLFNAPYFVYNKGNLIEHILTFSKAYAGVATPVLYATSSLKISFIAQITGLLTFCVDSTRLMRRLNEQK